MAVQPSTNKYLFTLSWRTGITLFNEKKEVSVLKDCIETAVKLCSSDHEIVQSTLDVHIILFKRVIERNEATIIEDLEEIGNDIANLL